jgi:malonate decarboxylase delta subunit
MERLEYRFAGERALVGAKARIVGVVASGNLEVLIEPARLDGACAIDVRTPARGFADLWQAVIADFCARHRFADARVSINDNGATPATVALRLDQAAAQYLRSVEERKA